MKKDMLQQATRMNQKRKHRKGWQTVVRTLALCVVFCTTYVLILPAITMQEETICGYEAHTHSPECYSQPQAAFSNCAVPADALVVHQHSDLCRNEAGDLVCTLPEAVVHTHDDSCYTLEEVTTCPDHVHSEACARTESTLVCEIPESEGHVHSESCSGTTSVLVCTAEIHQHGDGCYEEQALVCDIPESEEHTHSESCSGTQSVLVCTAEIHQHGDGCYEEQALVCDIPESEAHTHVEDCFTVTEIPCTEPVAEDEHVHDDTCLQQTRELTCTLPELQLHSHTEECFDAEGILVCELPVVVEHSHTETCLVLPESAEPVLTCGLEEHTHDTDCYPLEEEPVLGLEYFCGYAVHTHLETCYDEEGTLTCTIPEHVHEAACVVEDLDLTADVETEEDWMRSVSGMTLTGNWPSDVLAIARTQLDYSESVRNVVLSGDALKGYTRYGAWYGEPYADWNTLFAAFCMKYAAVKDFPMETDADRWAQVLTTYGIYHSAETYTPKPGDLIFIDQDQVEDAEEPVKQVADWMGIVEELIPGSEEAPAQIRLIAGDREDRVSRVTLDADDITIIGYAAMPAGDLFQKIYQGEDFTITATLTADTLLPETVQLEVREILPDTEEYQEYYSQSLAALTDSVPEEDAPAISFARFFDISFLVDGVAVEPAAPVNIEITYRDSISVKEEESGQVVHFAKDGVEVLQTNTSLTESEAETPDNILTEIEEFFTGSTEQVDTFQFTQGSFSVTGTLVSTRAAAPTATKVQPNQIDNTGSTLYVLYARINNAYYALDGNGKPVQITVNGDTLTLPAQNAENLMWAFVDKPDDNTNYLYNPVQNNGTEQHLHPYNGGVITAYAWDVLLEVTNDSFKIRGNDNYRLRMTATGTSSTTNNNQATTFYVAKVSGGGTYNVWFDGTLGGMMSYYGAADENRPVAASEDGTAVVELPETWQSSTKYDYTLRGWYDIKNHKYYAVNPNDNIQPTATINGSTVFYADWIAATYDVGQNNEHVVASLNTSDFITTYVFDYNALFNVMSQTHTGSVTKAGHTENWTIHNNGETVPYKNEQSLGFAFVDYDSDGDFSYARSRDNTNINQGGAITKGILTEVENNSDKDLLDLLFNPNTDVIGKYYAGTGDYLFQYMDSTTTNYDGEHDGYYYLDARLNAASYNQSLQRFYVYNYLERTSDSAKDGGQGQYSDLLPFNSPYIFDADQVDPYADAILRPGYEYDAKDGASSYQAHNSPDDATTNYFFGLRTDIEFFLPNDTNTQDEYGNYGNISTRGEHMVFEFHGDDDVWVFVDGQLLLDIGGLHGIMHGRIDFSTGTISYGEYGTDDVSTFSMSEGTHTMTVYYMERGSSQSNCAIYFNIAPRYDLEITKEDIVTANKLDGAVFSIFNDEAMREAAELWNSFEEHEAGKKPTNTFTVVDGIAKCWGISAGKTYYIYETTPPPGYPASDDMIRITLNNRGTATIETTTLHGPNEVATEGFAVIKQDVNDTLKIVALTVTNQKEGDTTEVRVEKTWDEDSVNLPQYITVYLTADGERIGRSANLTEANGWSYTWTGLPKYRDEGIDQEIKYVVEEVFVPNYITVQGDSVKVENYVDWVRVDQMSDSKTFLLVHNGMALTYNGTSFGWMERITAEAEASQSAHWRVTTDHDGFHLKNELGYTLTYRSSGFYGVNNDAASLNQVFYYLNSRLMVHDNDVYYQFGNNGSVVREDGLAFQLYQRETITGLLTNIVNKPVDEEKQTFVEVNKIWDDGADKHAKDSITIYLRADEQDTGRYLELNAANNWSGSFDDLPYYQHGTTTPIVYTVVEEDLYNYMPSYSDPVVLEGRPVSFWQNVDQLEAGDAAYRIYANGYSLAVVNNDVTTVLNDLEDEAQQWTVVRRNNSLILRNVDTKHYLRVNGSDLTTTSNQSYASAVTMSDGYITVGGSYLELGSGYASITASPSNIDRDALRVTRWATSTGMSGTGYTITNLTAMYELPQTGAMGTTSHYTFGGLLAIAAAYMYITRFGRKRQRGGKYSRK